MMRIVATIFHQLLHKHNLPNTMNFYYMIVLFEVNKYFLLFQHYARPDIIAKDPWIDH